ncbi:hypothetical protein [Algihabitans albus]|uniref:hypothetical protein n=1 Tax=Algihabitans albus TaxID=2164067 RepID=UPI000E5D44B9|nr:hypothetical protein [Algihabitans albus]
MDSRCPFIALAALLLLIQFIFVGIDHYNLETTQTRILENVETAVRGVDRAVTEELRVLATALAAKADILTNGVSQNAVARLDAQKQAELVQLAIAGTIIVLLAIVFMVFGERRALFAITSLHERMVWLARNYVRTSQLGAEQRTVA